MTRPSHSHCPHGCEHPQPFLTAPGVELCGRCWHCFGERVVMQPCTPETCGHDEPRQEEPKP